MNQENLEKELITAAKLRASMHGMRFGPGADSDIHRFASNGATRLFVAAQPAPEPSKQMIEEAKAAFEMLIDEMVSATSEITNYRAAHPGIIGEQTLRLALDRLCPLFPIC